MKQSDAVKRERLKNAIGEVVVAAIADSWKGGGDPADIPLIEKDLQNAMMTLQAVVDDIFEEKS